MRQRHPFLAAALAASPALAACAGMSSAGSGPITLSPEVQAYYAEYRALNRPLAFAVSADGRAAAYNYCPEGDCLGNEVNAALEGCRERSSGEECFIYDIGGRVVWRDATASAARPGTPPAAVAPARSTGRAAEVAAAGSGSGDRAGAEGDAGEKAVSSGGCAGDRGRPAHGSALIPVRGPHALTVENGTAEDAAVKLKRPDGTDAAGVYVHPRSTARLDGVPDGTYRVVFALGEAWSSTCRRFARTAAVRGFVEGDGRRPRQHSFVSERTDEGVRFSELRVTLHPVPDGNVAIRDLPADDF